MHVNIIGYITARTGLKQKDLAEQLGVSKAQISKWKAGEYISLEKREKLNEIAGLFGDDPEWAILVKTEENSQAWYEYFRQLNDEAEGYAGYQFEDEPEVYVRSILLLLSRLGIDVPPAPPSSTESTGEEIDIDEEMEPLDALLWDFLRNYGHLVQWWERYIQCTDHPDLWEIQLDLLHCAPEIALNNISPDVREAAGIKSKKFNSCFRETVSDARNRIHRLCAEMNELRIPFVADYFAFLHEDPEVLEDEVFFGDVMGDSTEKLLPFGERTILLEARKTNQLLMELHAKVDSLLSSETKDALRKKLRWARPDEKEREEC